MQANIYNAHSANKMTTSRWQRRKTMKEGEVPLARSVSVQFDFNAQRERMKKQCSVRAHAKNAHWHFS